MRLAALLLAAVMAAPAALAGGLPSSFSGPVDVARGACSDRAAARIEILPLDLPLVVTALGELRPALLEVDGPCGGSWRLLAQEDHGSYVLYEAGGRATLRLVGGLYPTHSFPFPTDTWTLHARLGDATEITSRDLVAR